MQCLVVEPRQVVSRLTPRAKTTSVRSMEHFRRWGLAERIRQVAPLKVDWSQDVVFCTTLLGHEVMRFKDCFGLSPQRSELFAESGQQIAQPLVEEVLREAVVDLNACQLCLGWSLRDLKPQDDQRGEYTRSGKPLYHLAPSPQRRAWCFHRHVGVNEEDTATAR